MANARSFLFGFKYSHKVSYVVEFSHLKIRIYAQHALLDANEEKIDKFPINKFNGIEIIERDDSEQSHDEQSLQEIETLNIVDSDRQVLEISSPYEFEDLWDNEELCCKLQTIQHSDIMYIFSEKHPIMALKRYAVDDWRLEELELINGPFKAMNTEAIVMNASAVSGDVVITASEDVFKSSDVGRLVRLRAINDTTKPWSAGINVQGGDICVSDRKYYEATGAGTTGAIKPVHGEGIRSDGKVNWKYLHDGAGIVKITQFTDARHVDAKVVARLPNSIIQGTNCWELGLIHQGGSYPKSGAFFRNRFAFLINTEDGPQVCLSMSGDYNNFSDLELGEVTAECAITVPVLNTEYNEGKWLYAGEVLFVGTGASEFYIDTISQASALANDNVKISQISSVGSKAIKPVGIGGHVFFADKYGLSLRDLMYNYYNEGYDQIDISLMGKHLFFSKIVAMSYQEVPYKILWCLMGDGTLTAVTFSAEQNVLALSRHDMNGKAESLTVISNFEDCYDEVWLVVKRNMDSHDIRTVEWMDLGMPQYFSNSGYVQLSQSRKEQDEKDYMLNYACYLDGAVLFERDIGDTRTEISGLSHMEGALVKIFADGAECESQVVRNGCVSISPTAVRVLIGFKIISQFVPQTILLPTNVGSGLGTGQRINHVMLFLYLSGGGKVGRDEEHLEDILYRNADGKLGSPEPLFSGFKEILFNGQTALLEKPAQIFIENDSALPMNILAVVPYMDGRYD